MVAISHQPQYPDVSTLGYFFPFLFHHNKNPTVMKYRIRRVVLTIAVIPVSWFIVWIIGTLIGYIACGDYLSFRKILRSPQCLFPTTIIGLICGIIMSTEVYTKYTEKISASTKKKAEQELGKISFTTPRSF